MADIKYQQHETRPGEARGSERLVTVFKIAKLETPAGNALCVIRNLSATGTKIESAARVFEGDRVAIEFSSDCISAATVKWSAAGFAGLQFDRPVDVHQVLGASAASSDAPPARAPRFDLPLPARVSSEDVGFDAMLDNISVAGAALTLAGAASVEPGAIIRLKVEGLDVSGEVRWQRGQAIGIRFLAPIPFRWLASRLAGDPAPSWPATAVGE